MRLSSLLILSVFNLGLSAVAVFSQTVLPRAIFNGPPPTGPTPAQLELVDKIEGVGPLKFGAKLESFSPDSLKAANPAATSGNQFFEDLNLKGISWGNLQPSHIELGFCFGQLATIQLRFNDLNGDLLAVNDAVSQKYGHPPYGTESITFGSGASFSCHVWTGSKIKMAVGFPDEIPMGVDASFLEQKVDAGVDLTDLELWQRLYRDKVEELRQKALEGHDIEKIKTDL